jgi:hypothetical protein
MSQPHDGWQSTAKLLRVCARAKMNDSQRAQFKTLWQGGCNRGTSIKAAVRHGMIPLLHMHLHTFSASAWDAEVRESTPRIGILFESGAARTLRLVAELGALLEECEQCEVQVVPFKGPVLAFLCYGNLLLRAPCDLDLLIRRNQLRVMEEALRERGYEREFHSAREPDEYAHRWVRRQDCLAVELHWAILPPRDALPAPLCLFWKRLEPYEWQGRNVWLPAPHDHVLLLCWHGYKHRWERLEWLASLSELLRQETAWDNLMAHARECGSQRALLLALFLAHDLLDLELPAFVVAQFGHDAALCRIAAIVRDDLSRSLGSEASDEFTPSRARFFHLTMRERPGDKVRYLARLLPCRDNTRTASKKA